MVCLCHRYGPWWDPTRCRPKWSSLACPLSSARLTQQRLDFNLLHWPPLGNIAATLLDPNVNNQSPNYADQTDLTCIIRWPTQSTASLWPHHRCSPRGLFPSTYSRGGGGGTGIALGLSPDQRLWERWGCMGLLYPDPINWPNQILMSTVWS
jgi:hypothetical protein